MASRRCEKCNAAAGATAKFCKSCGHKLDDPNPESKKSDKDATAAATPDKTEKAAKSTGEEIERQVDEAVSEMEAEATGAKADGDGADAEEEAEDAPETAADKRPKGDSAESPEGDLPGVSADTAVAERADDTPSNETETPASAEPAPAEKPDTAVSAETVVADTAEVKASTPEEAAPADEPESVPNGHDGLGGFTLEVQSGLAAGESVPVNGEGQVMVGAHDSCDLPLTQDDHVSRKHASFWVEDGRLMVKDEDSTNGTLLNVSGPRELAEGDVLVLGATLVQVKRAE